MARIRTIKPEMPQSESLGRCSRDTRLLFVLLFTVADDEGRGRAASRLLASLLFPYDDDAPMKIPEWLMELERENCVNVYAVDGNTYFQIVNWLDHQKIDKPTKSKLPAPPDRKKPRERATKPREPSPPPREHSSEDQGREGIKEGIKDQGREGTLICVEPTLTRGPPLVGLPTNTGDDFPIFEDQISEFERAYPAVDVVQELRKMRAWALNNQTQRKTRKGMLRFVNGWLSRAQDRGGTHSRGSPDRLSAHDKGTLGAAMWLREEEEREQARNGGGAGTACDLLPAPGYDP